MTYINHLIPSLLQRLPSLHNLMPHTIEDIIEQSVSWPTVTFSSNLKIFALECLLLSSCKEPLPSYDI